MDYDSVTAEEFGHSLKGVGINLLSPDVPTLVAFLQDIIGMKAYRMNEDFAILVHADTVMQIHADGTYSAHPVLGLTPENPPRGGGVQFYVFGVDPDAAAQKAEAAGHLVIEPPADKVHGLRECTILSPEGYAFSPALPKR